MSQMNEVDIQDGAAPQQPATFAIGGQALSKGAAAKHFAAMLKRYEAGESISGQDASDLSDLLALHPKAEQKRGGGDSAVSFSVLQITPTAKCFAVVRADGSRTDFSYHKCLEKPQTPLEQLLPALHAAAKPAMAAHQEAAFSGNADVRCPYTGEALTVRNSCVALAGPRGLKELATGWLEKQKLTAADVPLESRDKKVGARLADRALANSFKQYFAQHAVLEVVSHTGLRLARMSLADAPRGASSTEPDDDMADCTS